MKYTLSKMESELMRPATSIYGALMDYYKKGDRFTATMAGNVAKCSAGVVKNAITDMRNKGKLKVVGKLKNTLVYEML